MVRHAGWRLSPDLIWVVGLCWLELVAEHEGEDHALVQVGLRHDEDCESVVAALWSSGWDVEPERMEELELQSIVEGEEVLQLCRIFSWIILEKWHSLHLKWPRCTND